MTEGPFFTEPSITDRMRAILQPGGTAPVVCLRLNDRFFNKDFVHKCIDELERMPVRAAVGDPPSNLERLAYQLLLDSAYIDPKAEQEREERLKEYAKLVD